jgi:hypothetical protein
VASSPGFGWHPRNTRSCDAFKRATNQFNNNTFKPVAAHHGVADLLEPRNFRVIGFNHPSLPSSALFTGFCTYFSLPRPPSSGNATGAAREGQNLAVCYKHGCSPYLVSTVFYFISQRVFLPMRTAVNNVVMPMDQFPASLHASRSTMLLWGNSNLFIYPYHLFCYQISVTTMSTVLPIDIISVSGNSVHRQASP